MRKIKFRQAYYIKNEFHHWHYWGFCKGGIFTGIEVSKGVEFAQKYSQQFTGLKDKNGKEIYEGDIIQGSFPISTWLNKKIITDFRFLKAKIEWGLGGYVLEFIDIKSPDWSDKGSSSLMRFVYASCYFEVIGNIWENPELLKEA